MKEIGWDEEEGRERERREGKRGERKKETDRQRGGKAERVGREKEWEEKKERGCRNVMHSAHT